MGFGLGIGEWFLLRVCGSTARVSGLRFLNKVDV